MAFLCHHLLLVVTEVNMYRTMNHWIYQDFDLPTQSEFHLKVVWMTIDHGELKNEDVLPEDIRRVEMRMNMLPHTIIIFQ